MLTPFPDPGIPIGPVFPLFSPAQPGAISPHPRGTFSGVSLAFFAALESYCACGFMRGQTNRTLWVTVDMIFHPLLPSPLLTFSLAAFETVSGVSFARALAIIFFLPLRSRANCGCGQGLVSLSLLAPFTGTLSQPKEFWPFCSILPTLTSLLMIRLPFAEKKHHSASPIEEGPFPLFCCA